VPVDEEDPVVEDVPLGDEVPLGKVVRVGEDDVPVAVVPEAGLDPAPELAPPIVLLPVDVLAPVDDVGLVLLVLPVGNSDGVAWVEATGVFDWPTSASVRA